MKIQTLEEAANKANGYNVYAKETKAPIFNEGFIAGAKWKQEQDKVTEKEQKIEMLKSFLHDLQMGEDVEDVEAWFKQYEKQQKTE
jgi:hypothetical protein